MEKLCPACNGILSMKEVCFNCNGYLEDGGRADSYTTPYSPYFPDADNLSAQYTSQHQDYCLHLFFCPQCGKQQKKAIPYVQQ